MNPLATSQAGRRGVVGRYLRRTALAAAVGALSAAVLMPAGAEARKIANPSPPDFFAEINGGYLQLVGSNGSPLGLSLDFEKAGYARPSLRGTVASDGTITFPKAQVIFAPLQVPLGTDVVNLSLQPTTNWTGKIDPLTGRFDLDAPFRIQATGSAQGVALGGNCFLGSASNPLKLQVRTHAGAWPAADTVRSVSLVKDSSTLGGAYSAEPYSDEPGVWASGPSLDNLPFKARVAGSARAVDDSFAVPGASGCGPLNLADSQVNSQLGLPAPAGSSRAVIDVAFVPGGSRTGTNYYVNRGVAPKVVATGLSASPWLGSEVPTLPTAVAVSLNAGSSYFASGPNAGGRFQWDLGTGSYGSWTDTSVQTVSFDTPGVKTIRVTGRDVDGDVSTTTRQINVVPSTDIALAVSALGGNFRGGSNGTYRYTVTNNSTERANTQPITVTTSLPAGTTFVSASGTGWSCGNASGTVTCTRGTGTLAAGASSSIDITVAVSASASATLDSSASVAQAGDPDSSNDVANASTHVAKTDLTVTNTRNGDFTANGVWGYILHVSNIGDADTSGNTTVVVALPEGMTYRAAGSGGSGWTCSALAGTNNVSCSRTATVAANSDAPALTVLGRIANSVSGTVSSNATVTGQGDVDAFSGSNSDSEDAEVAVVPDLAVSSSHSGAFTVGDPGVYTVGITNEAVVDNSQDTSLSYDLPAGLKVGSVSAAAPWDCSATAAGSSRVDCVYPAAIAAGTSTPDVTVTTTVGHGSFPSTTHQPAISSASDGYAANNTTSDATSVKRINVTVSQTVAKSFSVGVEGVYRISATNGGDAATVGALTVTSELPASVKLKSVSGPGWDCDDSVAQRISCTRSDSLPAATSAGLITARVDVLDQAGDDGQVENTVTVATDRDDASVAGDAPVSGDNSSTITTKAVSVDLAVATSHGKDLLVGKAETIAIKVRNVGTFPTVKGASVTVTDQLPAGITANIPGVWTDRAGWNCSADGQTVTCELAAADSDTSALAVGQTAAIEIPVTASSAAAESSTNTVTVSTAKDASVEKSPNNQASDSLTVNRIDVALDASQSIAPRASGIGETTVNVTNSGTAATIDPITVTIPLAAGNSYRAAASQTAGWACSSAGTGTSVICERTPILAAGASAPTLKIRTDVTTAAPDTWSTEVSASTTDEAAALQGNNSKTLAQTLQKVDLKLVKSHGGSSIRAGSRGSFRLRVSNEGNLASSGVIRVTDTLDPVYTDITAAGSGWNCSVSGSTVECSTSASVAPGGRASDVTVGVNLPSSASGTYESSSLATLTNESDPYPANNVSADPTSVVTTQDLALSSTAMGDFKVGQLTSIRYRVRNVGSELADGNPVARIHDALPEGLVPVSATTNDAWDCDFAGGEVDCDLTQELEPGQASDLIVQVRVTGDAASSLGSVAKVTVGSSTQDINSSNDYAYGVYSVATADLSLGVSLQEGAKFETGRTTRFQIAVANHGTAATTGPIVVTVPLAKGASFGESGVYGTGWDCRLVGEDVRCEREDSLGAGESAPNLQVGLTPSTDNLPALSTTLTVATEGDEATGDNSVTRVDAITDLTPAPDTNITDGPAISTTSRSARIAFEASDRESTFECRLDGGAWAPCSSPFQRSNLEIGPHAFSVRAIGFTGKLEEEPAEFAWTIRAGSGGVRTPLSATMKSGSIVLPITPDPLALPADQLTIDGDVGEDGSWSVPASGIKFPVIAQEIDAAGIHAQIKIIISPNAGGAGTLTPGGGAASFAFPAKIKAEATLAGPSGGFSDGLVVLGPSSQCFLQPINFNLTGTYDRDAGTVSLSQQSVSLPKTSAGCGSLGATVDGALGLPRSDVQIAINLALGGGVKVGIVRPNVTTKSLAVPVLCKGVMASCSGAVEVIGRILSNGKYRTVTLARKPYRLAHNKGSNVAVGFSRSARRVVAKAGRRGMKVTVRVVAKGTRKPVVSRSVTLRK